MLGRELSQRLAGKQAPVDVGPWALQVKHAVLLRSARVLVAWQPLSSLSREGRLGVGCFVPHCSHTDSEPGILARMTSRVGLALPLPLRPQLTAWQPGLSMLICSCVCSGWARASSSPSENKKTCFASGGVEWGGFSGSRPAPQQGCQWAAACCYWRDSWLSSRLFPPAVQAWLAGEEAPGLRGPL